MIWPFAFWSFSLVFPVVTCVDQARFPHFLFAPSPLQRAVFASPSPPHVFMCYLTWESERGPKHSRDCEVATRLATGSRQAIIYSSDDRKKKRRPCVRQMRFRSFIPIQFCAHLSGKPPPQFSPKKVCFQRKRITSATNLRFISLCDGPNSALVNAGNFLQSPRLTALLLRGA